MSKGYGYNDDTRERLYEKFKREMLQPDESTYFDECDLIEIFDYANDHNDDATRTEVLMLASRLCPGSEALKVRKAFYYYDLEQFDMVKRLMEQPHEEGILWDILNVYMQSPAYEDLIKALDQMLARYDRLDDESMIQLVNLANSFNALEWVFTNQEKLKTMTDYQPTLLYEVAVCSQKAGYINVAIDALEELTSLEPFYAPYWVMLATCHMDNGDLDEARSDVEYALAIEPEDNDAVVLYANLMAMTGGEITDELMASLQKVYENNPYNENVVNTIGLMHRIKHNTPMAADIYARFLKIVPESFVTLHEYLISAPSIDWDLMEVVLKAIETKVDDTGFDRLVKIMSQCGKHNDAVKLLLMLYQHGFKLSLTLKQALVYEMYLANEFHLIDLLFTTDDSPVNQADKYNPFIAICYSFAMLRTGRVEEAVKFSELWIVQQKQTSFADFYEETMALGCVVYMEHMLDILANKDDDTPLIDKIEANDPIRRSGFENGDVSL